MLSLSPASSPNNKRARSKTPLKKSSVEISSIDEGIVQVAEKVCRELMAENDASHDYSHAFRVAATAHGLALQEPGCDVLVCRLASILHDIADHKYTTSPEEADGILANAISKLVQSGLSPARASHVKNVIDNVSFSKEINTSDTTGRSSVESLELAVVQDADKLDAIGAIGIARTFTFGGARKRPLYNPNYPLTNEIVELSGEEYAAVSTKAAAPTYDHFYEKLLRLQDMMKTESGRKRARERHAFMESFLEQFRDEVAGKA
mmetsp:Transcript_35274/g.71901  ORF Transcript_35274/g.71901 Transcript_35274/m.71901 type:complete len:263 (+) Transcript_35274:14-802(+)